MVAELDCFFVTVPRPEEKVVEMAAAPRLRSRTEIKPYTGKVCEVIYDCFGHLEGFVLESCYERHHFKTSEKGIGEIVLRACCERVVVTVYVEPPSRNKIREIVIDCAGKKSSRG